MNFARIIMLVVVCVFMLNMHAQDKKIDKIEMMYDQGNYKIVLRKTDKLQVKEEYKDHPSLIIFHALAEYQLSRNNEQFSSATAVYDYEKFQEKDSNQYYQKAYANYIYDMKMGIAEEIQELSSKGEIDKAKVKYNTYNRLFGGVANFEELTTVKPEVVEAEKPEGSAAKGEVRKAIIKEAEKHVGTPYKYGGVTPKGFDCSGYTQYVFGHSGIGLPRTASAQSENYEKIKIKDAKPGDLIFFGRNKNEISHVGIVYSNDKDGIRMIHASSSRGIMVSNINNDPYWSPKLQFVVKVVE